MTVTDFLIEVLEETGIGEAFEQGSLTRKYPIKFFTFWLRNSHGEQYYDNQENAVVWEFEVNFYTSVRSDIEKDFATTINALLDAGFIVSGRGHAVGSDEESHTGRGIAARYIQRGDLDV
jgi:hypothetical protein